MDAPSRSPADDIDGVEQRRHAPRARQAFLALGALLSSACGGPAPLVSAPQANAVPVVAASSVPAAPSAPRASASAPVAASSFSFEPRAPITGDARPKVLPTPLPIEELPLGAVPEIVPATSSPRALPPGDPANLAVDWLGVESKALHARNLPVSVRVTLPNTTLGRLRVGARDGTLGSTSGTSASVVCGGEISTRRITPMRAENIVVAPGAAPAYVISDGWFDSITCAGVVTQRTVIGMKPIAGGLAFAFREQCPTCSSTSAIHIVGPRAQQLVASGLGGDAATSPPAASFSTAVLPVGRGGGGALMERVPVQAMRAWHDGTGYSGAVDRDLVLGVEIVQGVDEQAPSAIVYVADPRVEPVRLSDPHRIDGF